MFRIHLPAAPGAHPEEAPEDGPIDRGEGRILVMDDEEGVRDVAGEMLRCLGYDADTVRDGDEALAAWRRAREEGRPYDAAILDLTVPGGMGGKETAERILAAAPGERLIVSSGYSNDAVMADWRAHGFRAAVPKPYRVEAIGTALSAVLREP